MIILGSRYQDETIYPAPLPNGEVQHAVYRTSLSDGTVSAYHVWQASDRIDVIAERYLGSGDLWWMIADINPEVLDPFAITPGTLLKVPSA
jgi:hypothetical protein